MALSPRELEDDIIIAHNEVRINPYVLINELERIIERKGAYYTPSTHMATLIGKRDLNDIVNICFYLILYLSKSSKMNPTIGERCY